MLENVLHKVTIAVKSNAILIFFVIAHAFLAIFLGEMYALAPDEAGYIATFNKVYTIPVNTVAQSYSGWIAAPTLFLWIVYSPANALIYWVFQTISQYDFFLYS